MGASLQEPKYYDGAGVNASPVVMRASRPPARAGRLSQQLAPQVLRRCCRGRGKRDFYGVGLGPDFFAIYQLL